MTETARALSRSGCREAPQPDTIAAGDQMIPNGAVMSETLEKAGVAIDERRRELSEEIRQDLEALGYLD